MLAELSPAFATGALALSLLALACSGLTMLQSRGPRVAQLERVMAASVTNLQNRIESTESTVRGCVEEAAESFERAESARKRAAASRSREDRIYERAIEAAPVVEGPVTRADVLAEVNRKLNGG